MPLVTGTTETDVAGALTYYFNSQQQVQRITFKGSTGDYRRLVGSLSSHYGFVRRVTNTAGLFVYEVPAGRDPSVSSLWIRSTPVFEANKPNERFEVTLLIERPATG